MGKPGSPQATLTSSNAILRASKGEGPPGWISQCAEQVVRPRRPVGRVAYGAMKPMQVQVQPLISLPLPGSPLLGGSVCMKALLPGTRSFPWLCFFLSVPLLILSQPRMSELFLRPESHRIRWFCWENLEHVLQVRLPQSSARNRQAPARRE